MHIRYTYWKFLRVVRNYVDGKIIKGMGRAEFNATFYHEYGTWIHTDSYIPFEQTYIFTICKDVMQVNFIDNRPFFTINITSPVSTFVHYCGQDTYKGWIKLLAADTFYTYIVVSGPRKNYSIKTLLKQLEKTPSWLFL